MKNLLQLTAVLVLAGTLSVQAMTDVAQQAGTVPAAALQSGNKAVSDVKKVADVNGAGLKAVPAGTGAVVDTKSEKEVADEHATCQKQINALKRAHEKEHGPLVVETEEMEVEAVN